MQALFLFMYLLTIRESTAVVKKYYLNTKSTELISYNLFYTPNFELGTFKHRCVWLVKNTDIIWAYDFHRKNLVTYSQKTYLMQQNPIASIEPTNSNKHAFSTSYSEPSDIVTYGFINTIAPNKYYYDFNNATGSLLNNFRGFYVDEYPDENGRGIKFATTQFGPIGSRYAFPSWDESQYRSKFTIIITRPKDYTCVISNSKLRKSTTIGNEVEDKFETTGKISPSSVAFTISKFNISQKIEGSIHRIVGRPEIFKLKKHKYADSLINRVYQELENFLQVNCELQNLYHVALPSNRMKFESLGTYRGINHYKEQVLIISNETPVVEKESSTIAIAKLIAQQWFLSYLMVDTWSSVWISEGLTNYLSYYVTAKLYPKWIIQERLASNIRLSMQQDSRCCGRSLNAEARKPSEIEAKFNSITVYKGTALIIMMERLIPPKVFTTGITNLVKDKKWSIYNATDLYQQFEVILNLNNNYEELNLPNKLSKIMSVWESQMGYPVVRVVRNYNKYDLDHVDLSQIRFHFDDSAGNAVWPIPINYATKSNPNFKNTKPTDWLINSNGEIRIKSLKKKDWLILNNQATYYYRVHYDDNNYKAITKELKKNHKNIHYLNRMQIIDDAFSLAEFGMLRYSIAFDISQYIVNERDYAPLKAMKVAWGAVTIKLADSKEYVKFQKYIKKSVESIYDKVKYKSKPNEDMHRNNLIVELLFSWLCDLNSRKCESKRFQINNPLDSKLRGHFENHKLCTDMRKADVNEWNQLFDKYKNLFTNSTDQIKEFNALGCNANSKILERFLNYVIASKSHQIIDAIKFLISHGITGLNVVIKYISILFNTLLKLDVENNLEIILEDIGSRVTTEQQLKKLVKFLNKLKKHKDLIKPCISRAKHNIEWRRNHLRGFGNYLHDTSTGTKHYNNVHAIVFITIAHYSNLILF